MSLKDTDVRTPGNAAIAKKWKLSLAKVNALVKIGAKHEKEHNTDEAKAEEVARDHINERPDYYTMLKKAEKTKIKLKEESITGDVRGLGYISGDPAVGGVNDYVNTNAMAYEDENGNNLRVIKQAHLDYHNSKLGFNFFDPTKIKDSRNTPLKEGTSTSTGLGGRHEGSKEDGPKYVDNNVKAYVRDLQIRADHQAPVHHDLHSDQQHDWFHSFKANKIKEHPNRTIKEAFKTKLQELGGSGEPDAYTGLSDTPPKGRKNDQLEEGPKLDKAKKVGKKVAMAGMTAANIYTMGDAVSQHKPHQSDMVRAATTLPGVAGWGASAVHYGKQGYDVAKKLLNKKRDHMEEENKMPNPCWKGYKAYGMKKKNGKEVPNCVPVEEQNKYPETAERGIYEDGSSYDKELEHPDFIHTVSREANLRDPKSVDAVLHVMHNRMGQKGYGSSPLGVVRQKGQFAGYGKGAAKGFTDEHKTNILNRAREIFSGKAKDITGGANEFRTTSAKNRPGGTVIGGNTFYKTGSFAKATPKPSVTPDTPKPTQVAQVSPAPEAPKPQQNPDQERTKVTPTPAPTKVASVTPSPASAPEAPKPQQNPDQNITKVPDQPKKIQVAAMEEDWQSVNRKDKTDGLSQKAVNAYRREHPGSKLKTAVTEKNPTGKRASRRKSFCSRMGGMKKRLTSAKTARDPDSRINKALRRWNCEESVINELRAETLGSYIKKASASRKKSLEGNNADIKTWGKRQKGITTAIKQLTKENSRDKDWDAASGFAEQQSHLHLNKPDVKYAPGASGITHTIHEETKMDNQNLVNEAIENILENDLVAMKENFMVALQEKAQEKLEERKKIIAANYFAQ